MAAPTYELDFTNTYAASTTCAVTVSGYTVGDIVFVCITKSDTNSRTISSVVDNAGTPNTYTSRATVNEGTANQVSAIWSTVVTDASATTVTVTWSGSASGRVCVIVATPTGTTAFDTAGTDTTGTSVNDHPCSAGINIAAESFAVAVGQLNASGGTITPPTDWTRFPNDGATNTAVFFYREVASALTTHTATWNSTTARNHDCAMASFTSPAAAGGATFRALMLLGAGA